ncbi:hypothetical protein DL93DRAFT_2100338 [Clavulina sp. PMI_390]|nr:hypothetical protein DL93DRAFT_2100338 [Clavulina sp. PMI_390]
MNRRSAALDHTPPPYREVDAVPRARPRPSNGRTPPAANRQTHFVTQEPQAEFLYYRLFRGATPVKSWQPLDPATPHLARVARSMLAPPRTFAVLKQYVAQLEEFDPTTIDTVFMDADAVDENTRILFDIGAPGTREEAPFLITLRERSLKKPKSRWFGNLFKKPSPTSSSSGTPILFDITEGPRPDPPATLPRRRNVSADDTRPQASVSSRPRTMHASSAPASSHQYTQNPNPPPPNNIQPRSHSPDPPAFSPFFRLPDTPPPNNRSNPNPSRRPRPRSRSPISFPTPHIIHHQASHPPQPPSRPAPNPNSNHRASPTSSSRHRIPIARGLPAWHLVDGEEGFGEPTLDPDDPYKAVSSYKPPGWTKGHVEQNSENNGISGTIYVDARGGWSKAQDRGTVRILDPVTREILLLTTNEVALDE